MRILCKIAKERKMDMKKRISIVLSVVAGVTCFAVAFGAMIATEKIPVSETSPLYSLVQWMDSFKAGSTGTDPQAVEQLTVPEEDYLSPGDISISGGFGYVADNTGDKVYKVNLSNNSVVATYEAGEQVNAVYAENDKVYILQGALAGNLVITDTNFGNKKTVEVGHTPVAIAVSGSTAYVANRFSDTVSVVNVSTSAVTATVKVGREPMSMAMTNGNLYVASHLPEDDATGDSGVVSADIYVINTASNTVSGTVETINGTGSVKDICVSSDGKTLYASCVVSRYTYPTTQLDRGWINTNAVAVIDVATGKNEVTVLLDDVDLGAANPWGIGVTADGSKLVVAASGTHEAVTVNLTEMNNRINAVKNGNGLVKTLSDIVDYVPFLDGIKTRVSLGGNGPRGLAVSGDKVYFAQYFSGNLAVLNMTNNAVSIVSLGTQPQNDAVRQGNVLFYDATVCYQKWQSCASCHPDARTDGFNWDNMNDGLGNPKSTKSMLYSHRTPPVMVTGIRANAETAVRAGMKYIEFNNLDEASMVALDEYLKSLVPEQSPYLNRDGTLTESAQRGAKIFETAGCVTCHPAPLYTDLKTHQTALVSQVDGWENRPFDTPTLVEIWRTGPYHFNGMHETMTESIKADAPNLSEQNRTDLANFVLSIGAENELYGIEQVFGTDKDGNTLYSKLAPASTVKSFSVRKQWVTNETAKVTVKLCKKNGTVLDSYETTLAALDYNRAVTVTIPDGGMAVPTSLEKGDYLVFSIANPTGTSLATDLTILYDGGAEG